MIKVKYDNQTGKILGYYADEIDYKNVVIDPYIEITFDERKTLFNPSEDKEFRVDLSTLRTEDEIIEYDEMQNVDAEIEEEEPYEDIEYFEEQEPYEELNEETEEYETNYRTVTHEQYVTKYRTVKRIETECRPITKTRVVPHYKGEIKLYDIEYTAEELAAKEQAKKEAEIYVKINELKRQLSDMDYKTSKYTDGDYTNEEWQLIVTERKELRRQIRELECQY